MNRYSVNSRLLDATHDNEKDWADPATTTPKNDQTIALPQPMYGVRAIAVSKITIPLRMRTIREGFNNFLFFHSGLDAVTPLSITIVPQVYTMVQLATYLSNTMTLADAGVTWTWNWNADQLRFFVSCTGPYIYLNFQESPISILLGFPADIIFESVIPAGPTNVWSGKPVPVSHTDLPLYLEIKEMETGAEYQTASDNGDNVLCSVEGAFATFGPDGTPDTTTVNFQDSELTWIIYSQPRVFTHITPKFSVQVGNILMPMNFDGADFVIEFTIETKETRRRATEQSFF